MIIIMVRASKLYVKQNILFLLIFKQEMGGACFQPAHGKKITTKST